MRLQIAAQRRRYRLLFDSLFYSNTQTYMDRQDGQDKNQKKDKYSLFRAKAMNPHLLRPAQHHTDQSDCEFL